MKKQSFQLAVHCNHRIQAKDGDQNNHHGDSLDGAETKYSKKILPIQTFKQQRANTVSPTNPRIKHIKQIMKKFQYLKDLLRFSYSQVFASMLRGQNVFQCI